MITTVTGSNSFALKRAVRTQIDAFVAKHTDMGLERLDGEDATYVQMRAAAESLPFLTSRKLVVLRTPGAQKDFMEHFGEFLKAVPETTDVLIIEPKPDKRSSYYKALQKHTDLQLFDELDENGVSAWLVRSAKEQGAILTSNDARYLVSRVGASQQLLVHELEKLATYSSTITRETIDLLTEPTPQASIFDLLDAAFAGNHQRALQLYEQQRRAKVEPQYILAMIAWQLHIMTVVKSAGQRDPAELAKQAKLSPFVVRKTAGLVRSLSLQDIRGMVARALQLDVRLKSESLDADDAVQNLILKL